jgi:preprotein translocase subunit SecE
MNQSAFGARFMASQEPERLWRTIHGKPNTMLRKITAYFSETKEELSRVSWPSRENVTKHTLLVIVVSVSIAAYLGAADLLFTFGLEHLINR